ncbi:MAG: hypothetical protein VKO65_04885 [Cyanobacteriota bacterium]|nr:hypothetical protein [Cyanobacteriota bacterium]
MSESISHRMIQLLQTARRELLLLNPKHLGWTAVWIGLFVDGLAVDGLFLDGQSVDGQSVDGLSVGLPRLI